MMKRLGFFSMRTPLEAAEELKFLVRIQPDARKDQILAYLRSGLQLGVVAGPTRDLLDQSGRLLDPPNPMTDGVWLWTRDVVDYVDRYNMELPKEFLQHASRNLWSVPRVNHPERIIAEEIRP